MPNWLAEVRARLSRWQRSGAWTSTYDADFVRLLECAEALAELVAVHDKPGRYPPSGDRGAAWERARKVLEGGNG